MLHRAWPRPRTSQSSRVGRMSRVEKYAEARLFKAVEACRVSAVRRPVGAHSGGGGVEHEGEQGASLKK